MVAPTEMIAASLRKYLSPEMALLVERLISQMVVIPEMHQKKEVLEWVLKLTQSQWLRKPGTERWEVEAMMSQYQQVAAVLNHSELMSEQVPSVERVQSVLLMSAIEPVFIKRLEYFSILVQRGLCPEKVYLLGGERKLDVNEEANIIEILGPDAREIEMLEYHAERLLRRDSHLVDIDFIRSSTDYQCSEDGRVRRPNTRDTVLNWSRQDYFGGDVLCLSNQPFVHYQTAVVRSVLGVGVTVIGAGPAADLNAINSTLALDAVARLIYTLLSTNIS